MLSERIEEWARVAHEAWKAEMLSSLDNEAAWLAAARALAEHLEATGTVVYRDCSGCTHEPCCSETCDSLCPYRQDCSSEDRTERAGTCTLPVEVPRGDPDPYLVILWRKK